MRTSLLGKAVKDLILILSPFTPHICEEMWHHIGQTESVTEMSWPEFDPSALIKDEVEIVVQINGKLKGTVTVPVDSEQDAVVDAALAVDKVKKAVEGMQIVKTILVKNKLVNLIVKPAK